MLPSPAMRTAGSAAGGPAPVKTASAGARKSGQSIGGLQPQQQQQQQETRTARKTSGPRVYRDEEHVIPIIDKSEAENTSPNSSSMMMNNNISRNMAVKSSSTMSPVIPQHPTTAHRPSPSTATTTTTSTDESSVLPPLVQSRRGGKDNMQIYNIPPGVNKPGLGGKGKGKGVPAGPIGGRGKDLSSSSHSHKRQAPSTSSITDSTEGEEQRRRRLQARRREETEETTTEDQSSSLNVRSRSPRGYTWEVEVLEIKPEDVKHRISYHNSITTTIEREGKNERVRFRRGDKIWILPDPQWLPPVSHEVEINELADDEWWVGEILDCCALDSESQQSGSLGLLRVAWYYSPDHAFTLDDLHSDWKKKIRKYRFDDPERIKSDHVDFVGIECFAGFADGIYTYLNISGLEVDDIERMKAEHRRKKSNRVVRMTGFTLKDVAKRQAAREAELERNPAIARRVKRGVDDRSTRRRLSQPEPEDDDDKIEEQDYYA